MRRLFLYSILFLACCISGSPLHADLVFNVTEANGGGATFLGSGSGAVDRSRSNSRWDLNDFNTSFLESSVGNSEISFSATGTLTNSSSGQNVGIIGFGVDRDGNGGDDIFFQTDSGLSFTQGDDFVFSIVATSDVGTLPFSSLILGTHIEPGGAPDEIFGVTTMVISSIPEPTAFAMFSVALVALSSRRRFPHG
ncbi:MAG: hypothetical protein AAFN77_22910 [Planctomycetota bacterium]